MPHSSLPPPPPPPPRAVSPSPYAHATWGLGDAWAALGIFFIVSIVVGLAVFGASQDAGLDGIWLPLAVGIPPVVQGIYVWYVAGQKGRGIRHDFGFSFEARDILLGAALTVAGLMTAGLVGALMLELFDSAPEATVAELTEDSADGGGLTVWIILLAVLTATVAPVVEELVFRGLWWSALEKRGMKPGWILIVTSLVFAGVHLELQRTPILFVLGLALGAGRLATGRIGPAIIAHAMINGIGMLFLLIEISEPGTLS